MAVATGRLAAWAWLTLAVVLVAAPRVPTAACRAVVAAAPSAGAGEAEELQCVGRCTTEMLACAAASGCASATRWGRRRGGGGIGAPCSGRGCETEYLGCIDVC
jgi:hypothetical protein